LKQVKFMLYFLAILLLAVPSLASGTSADIGKSTNLRAEILRYEPYPAEPGEYVDVWVRFETSSSESSSSASGKWIENAKVSFVDSYPFSVDSESERTKDIGSMTQNDVAVVKFKVRVDENAVDGENDLKLRFFSKNKPDGVELTLKVQVRSLDIRVGVEGIQTEPEKLVPGQPAKMKVKIKNYGGSRVTDVAFKLDVSSDDIPIAPLHSGAEKKLKDIKPGEEAELDFDIAALSDAEAKVYKVPVEITYYDELGTMYTKEDIIGLRVGAEPDFVVNLEDTEAYQVGKAGKLVLSISNVGPSEINYVTIELLPSDSYEIIGKAMEYLGNLDPDDFESAQFKIYPKSENADLNIKISYKDSYNNAGEKVIKIPLPIYTARQLGEYGLDGKTGQVYVKAVIYILLALFLYYTYGAWRQEKRIDKAVKVGLKMLGIKLLRAIKWFRWRNLRRLPRRIRLFWQQV